MKDEALKLALEALESCYVCLHEDEDIPVAIAAIKQALAAPTSAEYAMGYAEGFNDGCKPAPVQEPEYVYTCIGCGALYREDDTSCDCTVHGLMQFTRHILMPDTTAAPVQEPVAWRYTDARGHYRYRGYVPGFDVEYRLLKPKALCLCTPPAAAPAQETVLKDNSNYRLDPPGLDQLYTTPPAAQRQWVGLTDEEVMNATRKEGHELLDFIYEYGTGSEGTEERVVAICKAIEAKLKEKNT